MRLFAWLFVLAATTPLYAQDGWRCDVGPYDAGWGQRMAHNCAVFNDRLWILNGLGHISRPTLTDAWSSANGVQWDQDVAVLPWLNRRGFQVLPFNGRLWVVGGFSRDAYRNDVWSSPDGVNWTEEIANAPWTPRHFHTCVVFNGKLWLFGGFTLQASVFYAFNDVWSTHDGVNWTLEVASATWSARSAHTAAVFNGRMWVLGGADGSFRNDVWSSADGVHWVREIASAPWEPRSSHLTVAFNSRLWVLGGGDGMQNFTDIWSSTDGVTWALETSVAPWGERVHPSLTLFKGRLWLLGGAAYDDVWSYGLHVKPGVMPDGMVSREYDAELTAREAVGTVAWVVTAGALPPGLALAPSGPATARLAGTPIKVGNFAFTVEVTDADGHTATQEVTLMIRPIPAAKTSASGCTTPGPTGSLPLALGLVALLRRRRAGGRVQGQPVSD